MYQLRSLLLSMLKNVPAILIGCLIAFVLLEVTVRVFFPQAKRLYIADPYTRTIHRPSVETVRVQQEYSAKIRTNAQGWVGDDFVLEKEPEVTRIAMLGDSFTEGFVVDEEKTYVRRFDDMLHANTDSAFDVYNFGLSGAGTGLELLVYKHYASAYKPDWTLLQFYIRNDYTNDYFNKDRPEFTLEQDETNFYGQFREFLSNNFQSPRFVIRKLDKIKAINQWLVDLNVIARQYDPEVADYPYYFEVFNSGNTTVYDQAFEHTCGYVEELKELVEADGGQLAAYIIPAKEQLYEADWQAYLDEFPAMQAEEWDMHRPSAAISNCFIRHEVPFIDLEERLAEHIAAGGERMYYQVDDHFNELGNEIVAEELDIFFRQLTQNNQ